MRLGLGLALSNQIFRNAGGTPTPAPAPGSSATTFTTTPQTQFHPNAQAGSVTKNGSVVTACPDLRGLAALSAGSTTGPVEMTDALGRKFWRFEGAQFAQIAAAFAATSQGVSVIFVGRNHKSVGTWISPGLNGAAPATPNSGLLVPYTTGGAPYTPRIFGNLSTSSDAANRKFMAMGHQLHVVAVRAGVGATGTRTYINNDKATRAGFATANAFAGMELGRFALNANSYGNFDLYEVALFNTALADATMDAAVAEVVTNWQIPQITKSLILEGDSRIHEPFANTGITTGNILGMLLTNPGAGLIPEDCRVITLAASGDKVSNMVLRKNAASPSAYAADMMLPGENHVAYIMGTNDGQGSGDVDYGTSPAANTTGRGDLIYAADVAMLNNATVGQEGLLQRGFIVTRGIEPQQASNSNISTEQLRLRHRDAAFMTDCLAGVGQSFDGKLRRLEIPNITIGGVKPFDTAAGIPNAYYNDTQHPNAAGAVLWTTGGDTPANGFGAVL